MALTQINEYAIQANTFASLKGQKGEVGVTGDKGEQGIQGTKGDVGPKGEIGDKGDKGSTGATGDKGDQGIKGDTGQKGDTGSKGDKGEVGVTGDKGETGQKGDTGSKGDKGEVGATGATGAKGETGAFGGAAFDYTYDTGTSNTNPGVGLLAFNNTTFSSATKLFINNLDDLSANVYSYLQTIDDSTSAIKGHFTVTEKSNTANFVLYSITGNHLHHTDYFEVPVSYLSGVSSMIDNTDIIITFARTGDVGDKGTKGDTGATGATGDKGTSGDKGDTGSKGDKGDTGSKGDKGIDGVIGVNGDKGDTGAKGDKGDTGQKGDTGAGTKGDKGEVGPVNYFDVTADVFTGNGSANSFTLSVAPVDEGHTIVVIDGVAQLRTSYDISGNTITFGSAPSNNAAIEVTTIAGGAKGDKGDTGSKGDKGEVGSKGDVGPYNTFDLTLDSFTGNGSATAYTLTSSPIDENHTIVVIEGVAQLKTAYSVSGNTLTFSSAPANGYSIEVTTIAGGAKGQKGDTGATGSKGDTGSTGSSGSKGDKGDAGSAGSKGDTGATGDAGAKGDTGATGTAGAKGDKGDTGATGSAGATGSKGDKGDSGGGGGGSNTQILFNDSGSSNGSAAFTFDKTSNTITVGGNIVPSANVSYDLGTSSMRFKDLYLSGNTINLGTATLTISNNVLVVNSGGVSTSVNTPRYISVVQTGSLTAPVTSNTRYYPPASVNLTKVYATVGTAPSGNFSFILKKNGTSIGTFTIASGAFKLAPNTISTAMTANDYLTMEVSSGSASELLVEIEYLLV